MNISAAVGDVVLYHYASDTDVPALVEKVQENNIVELTYFYKGEPGFAVAKEGRSVYEYSHKRSRL